MRASRWVNCVFGAAILSLLTGIAIQGVALANPWSSGYFAHWAHRYPMTPANIDFDAVTHIIDYAVCPLSNGTLDDTWYQVTAAASTDLIQQGHAHGKKVLISLAVEGATSHDRWFSATQPSTVATFVSNIVAFMSARGYDGVDIDWEPLQDGDAAQFTAFIEQLRASLNRISTKPLLTVAVSGETALFSNLQANFDQINIMTYDLAGPWDAPYTWHNSALYAPYTFPTLGAALGSVDLRVNQFVTAGVAPSKLGIGLPFYGYLWQGGTELRRRCYRSPPDLRSAVDVSRDVFQRSDGGLLLTNCCAVGPRGRGAISQ